MINMSFNGKRRDRKIQWFTSRKAGAISSIDFHPTGEQLISAGEVRLTTIGCQFSSDFNTEGLQNRSDYVRLTIMIGSDSICSMMVLCCHRMDCEFGIFVRVA